MKYQITTINQIKALLNTFLTIFYFLIFYTYYKYTNTTKDAPLIFILITFIVFPPVIYLHIEYLYFNKNCTLEIEQYENKIIYTDKTGKKRLLHFNELSKIILYLDFSWYQKRSFRIFPFSTYHYARIFTKSGEEIIITCLMASNVEKALSIINGIPVEKKIRPFASILIR